MTSDKILILTISALVVVGIDVLFRQPIFDINIQTTMKFDIFTVLLAYVMGFVVCLLGKEADATKKEEKGEILNEQ